MILAVSAEYGVLATSGDQDERQRLREAGDDLDGGTREGSSRWPRFRRWVMASPIATAREPTSTSLLQLFTVVDISLVCAALLPPWLLFLVSGRRMGTGCPLEPTQNLHRWSVPALSQAPSPGPQRSSAAPDRWERTPTRTVSWAPLRATGRRPEGRLENSPQNKVLQGPSRPAISRRCPESKKRPRG